MLEIAIIVTNALVVVASLALALVTFADVVKDQNKTLLAAIKDTLAVANPRGNKRKVSPQQTELALVPEDEVRKVA